MLVKTYLPSCLQNRYYRIRIDGLLYRTFFGRMRILTLWFFPGSSFPKAKPTLSMRRVVWYALVRLVFLPALFQWWAQQTSPACAKFLLALWLMQVVNMSLYFMSPATLDIDVSMFYLRGKALVYCSILMLIHLYL